MARINIEECWWSDPRRSTLIKLVGVEAADGAAIGAWRIAQEFWAKGMLVPKAIWSHVQANAKLIEANLAEERADGIYVRGSSEYLSWVAERREAARAGGLKSAQKRSKESKQTPTKRKQTQPSGSGSYSSSGSSSDSEVSNSSNSTPKSNDFIAAYCRRFKDRWGHNPPILGKDSGIAKRLAKDLSLGRFEDLLDAYFQMPDAWVVKAKHTLGIFEAKLNEVAVFAESGKFTTAREVRNADNMAANMMLLKKIDKGEV